MTTGSLFSWFIIYNWSFSMACFFLRQHSMKLGRQNQRQQWWCKQGSLTGPMCCFSAFYRKGVLLRSWPEERKPFGQTPEEEHDNFSLWRRHRASLSKQRKWFPKEVRLTRRGNWLGITNLWQVKFKLSCYSPLMISPVCCLFVTDGCWFILNELDFYFIASGGLYHINEMGNPPDQTTEGN